MAYADLREYPADRVRGTGTRLKALHRADDEQGDRLDAIAALAGAEQAVAALLRDGVSARAAPRAEGVDRQIQRKVRPGLGQGARGNTRPPDQARRRSTQHAADDTTGGDSGLGQPIGGP